MKYGISDGSMTVARIKCEASDVWRDDKSSVQFNVNDRVECVRLVMTGVVGMCKEHLGVALALKVPVFFVITKVWLLYHCARKHIMHVEA